MANIPNPKPPMLLLVPSILGKEYSTCHSFIKLLPALQRNSKIKQKSKLNSYVARKMQCPICLHFGTPPTLLSCSILRLQEALLLQMSEFEDGSSCPNSARTSLVTYCRQFSELSSGAAHCIIHSTKQKDASKGLVISKA